MMNDILETSSKELIVRKRITNFIEKVLKYFGYDFYHDDFKKVIYSELAARTTLELKAKNYYDAYMYLLENRKSAITTKLLSKFFYLAIDEIIDEEQLRIITLNYYLYKNINIIDKAIYLHNEIYNFLSDKSIEIRTLISLMFFNFELVRNDVPSVQFRFEFLKEYEKIMQSNNQNDLYYLFKECLEHAKFQDKEYYLSLFKLTQYDVVNKLLENKSTLTNKYFVKELYMFGSFAKGIERIDSDLDFLVKYSLDINIQEKNNIIKELKNLLIDTFKRFVDLKEITVEINDEFIINNSLIIKII